MAEEKLTLIDKLAKIRTTCEVLSKNGQGYGYKYVTIDEVLAKVTAGMKKYHVSLIPGLNNVNVEQAVITKTKVNRDTKQPYDEKTTEYLVTGTILYTWVDDENPADTIPIAWFLTGSQSDPSQSVGSALTYSLRYFLMNYFQIATPENDPDLWRSKQKAAAEEEDARNARAIIDEVNKLVTAHLESNPDSRTAITEVVKKHVRVNNKPSADYYKVTDPVVASKLFEEISALTSGENNKKEGK